MKATQLRKGLNRAGSVVELIGKGQCSIAPPVNQEPSIEYSLSGAEGPALSARYPVSATQVVVGGKKERQRAGSNLKKQALRN